MSEDLQGKTDSEKLANLCSRPYKAQAIWFLNAFWDKFSGEAEKVWGYVRECCKLDLQNREEGSGLDEHLAHRFLEVLNETLTVLILREELRRTGAIAANERPKVVPLIHYLLFRYKTDWHFLVNTKGDNSAELTKAQQLFDATMAAFAESEKKANEARLVEAPFKAAQEEVETAVAEVRAQEDARNNKTEDLQKRSTEGGVVAQNKAKAELAQHLAEDPLPLRKAKITLEAALKKAEKARAPFEAARKAAEDSLEIARQKLAEAEAYLAEVKAKPGNPHGRIWWMERELEERKKFLPTRKGGVSTKEILC
jgi:hypothetical protein